MKLFDDLVGGGRERHRHVDAQRPGGFQVQHELELDGLDHRQLAWLFTLENGGGAEKPKSAFV